MLDKKMKEEILDWLDTEVLTDSSKCKYKDLALNIMNGFSEQLKKSLDKAKPESNKSKANKIAKLLESES